MNPTKFVLRVVDDANVLYGWVEVPAEARGDGCLWAKAPALLAIECAGAPTVLSVHWADVNVELRREWTLGPVSLGQIVTIPNDTPLLIVGPMATGLVPVTVRGAAIVMPVGVIGALT